jgi:hypothetical protein
MTAFSPVSTFEDWKSSLLICMKALAHHVKRRLNRLRNALVLYQGMASAPERR